MSKIKVKYCGLTTLDDVQSASEAQVDAIGLVFVEKSPRYIKPENAVDLSRAAKLSGIKVVALFADHPVSMVKRVIAAIEPDVLQFHGNESVEYCEQFKMAYWKAVPMLETCDYQTFINQYPNAQAFLLDAYGGNQTGGSGQSFNWFQFPQAISSKLILAGGIHIDNVVAAVAATGAQFIDTSSGIESKPGVKSKAKMLALMTKIKTINSSKNNK